MTMETKPNHNGVATDHRHPNHTIITMCGDKNSSKQTKMAPCQSEIDIAEPVSI